MFSVIIPLYNKECSIENTILSVLKQSYQNFEIIIINDGSTDNSAQVVSRVKDKRIRLIHQQNQGVSAARNKGVREAKYEWVAFLDGDDFWESNHLEEIVKMMKIIPNEKVYVTSFKYSNNRKMYKHIREDNVFKINNYFKEAIRENLICTIIIALHKDCFNSVGFFNENLNRGEDLDLWIRLVKKFNIVKSRKITAIYSMEDVKSLTKSKSNYNKSILSIIDLKGKQGFERLYLKKMLISRIKLDIKTLDVKDLLRILVKHNFELLR